MGLSGVSALEVQPFGGQAKFDFDAALVTFTAAMAKRTGAVFAAAPIVQGHYAGTGTPDALTAGRGTQVSGTFYANIDATQGGGFLIWTPEHSSADRTDAWDAYLFTAGNDYTVRYEWDNNRYGIRVGNNTIYVSATLTAGTSEYLAWGFDTNQTLDGTNYVYLSRNDTQTFGGTGAPGTITPDATFSIGADYTCCPSNGIIEGLTLVREIPRTGAYGTDMGQGDIVAAHAAGADVCLSIGSWGVTFCLPTNATKGALATGVGEAWSHPHGSALLTDTFGETTYGSSAWGDEGTPSTGPADLAAAERIFLGGYKWTCAAADDGITQTIACAAGADFVLRAIAHCTSANDIRVRIWDETNGAQIGADFDFGASSSRTVPGVALFCFEAPTTARNGVGSNCTSISVKVMGTANTQEVFCHQVEVYANLIDNPSLETFDGATPPMPDGWTNNDLDAGDTQASSTGGAIIHSGSDCIQWNIGASNERMYQSLSLTVGGFYAWGGWAYGDGASGQQFKSIDALHARLHYSASAYSLITGTAASWVHVPSVWRATKISDRLEWRVYSGASGNRYADDIYVIALTALSLTATAANAANSAETSGLRVDGYDSCTQPITRLKATKGTIRWTWTPRHDAANLMKFEEGTGVGVILLAYRDADNYIVAFASAANTISLGSNVAGAGWSLANWDCTGAVVANTSYLMEIRYTAGKIELLVDSVVRATNTRAVDFGVLIPNVAYWGGNETGADQADGTFAAP